MDLRRFSLEDLLLAAIKSEVESEEVYRALGGRVKNFMLRDRLSFLADEEKKHAAVLRTIHAERFPGRDPAIPRATPVPLPRIACADGARVSDVLLQAVEAESAASAFYANLAPFFPEGDETRRMLTYLSRAERSHRQILEDERQGALEIEEADEQFPLFHVGP